MARVSGTASLGLRVGLGHKEGYTQYDSTSPHHSITIEREVSDDLTDEELVVKATELNGLARSVVEREINKDLKDALSKD